VSQRVENLVQIIKDYQKTVESLVSLVISQEERIQQMEESQ
jgi:hypothetical protein